MSTVKDRISARLKATSVKFEPGFLALTPGAEQLIRESAASVTDLLLRHISGDWGTLDTHDRRANDDAVEAGLRILSQYDLAEGRLWIITEASDDVINRPSTTLLLPEEY